MANRLRTDQRARIVGCLTEGMSIRATVRVTPLLAKSRKSDAGRSRWARAHLQE